MQTRFLLIRSIVITFILLQLVCACHADTCYKHHKRAPVRAVCGRVHNVLGERPNGIELTLSADNSSSRFSAKTDDKGGFVFGPVPKGDYTLRASAPGYTPEERPLRISGDGKKSCTQQINVTLGFRSCDGGTYIRGFDKKSDLRSDP